MIKIFDGAMGTMLQKMGLKVGENPELFNIKNEEVILEIHKSYIEAGADIITTNTFGANRKKLRGLDFSLEEVITKGVDIAKKARGNKEVKIALDIGPIGELLEPMGILSFDEAYEIFKEQVVVGKKNGVDLILIETMSDLYEAKAAILAAKENSDLPVFCTMSFEENERTFTGCIPESMAMTLEGLGVDALGVNCSLGPIEMENIVRRIVNSTNLEVIVQANAGMPSLESGELIYKVDERAFGECAEKFVELGVSYIGGCCGTTPEYINEISSRLKGIRRKKREKVNVGGVCTPSLVAKGENEISIIGERINPTGKKRFKEALINEEIDYIVRQGIEQVEAGAKILDVNVGIPEIDEKYMMVKIVKELQSILDTPLQIDSSDPNVIEEALRYYNGKCIVNSVNGEEEVLDNILPLVKKYGAMVVGLTLNNKGIPKTCDEKLEIGRFIINKALAYEISKDNIILDPLVLTVATNQKEVRETLDALRKIKEELGVKTAMGVSNISFGLPNRENINEVFLGIALNEGLDFPIVNPNKEGIMKTIRGYELLSGIDEGANRYIEHYSQNKEEKKGEEKVVASIDLKDIVIKGRRGEAKEKTKELLKEKEGMDIVNSYLIPALDIVGGKFEREEIFLPQLIASAETVKESFEVIKSSIDFKGGEVSKGKIVLATVKGDIHDIGKNIVKVILENYGYDIIDLGKNVEPKIIVETCHKHKVKLLGLSALMTTTLKSMEDTIEILKKEGLKTKVFVGGAVLTEGYSKKIGADFYAKDANKAVEIAKHIFKK
ncbi:homocysteine S-methyltransferase family protein [Clostridium sp. B9]|uniref:homocysteine S-methyltransferase family protein n=1 Tax=Clostridium sp. B9 TaxID=3423224 RepID=UPI003D2EC576